MVFKVNWCEGGHYWVVSKPYILLARILLTRILLLRITVALGLSEVSWCEYSGAAALFYLFDLEKIE